MPNATKTKCEIPFLCSSYMFFHGKVVSIVDDVMADDVWAHKPRDKNNVGLRHFP